MLLDEVIVVRSSRSLVDDELLRRSDGSYLLWSPIRGEDGLLSEVDLQSVDGERWRWAVKGEGDVES